MKQALVTVSVLAIVSFGFSTAVALAIASHARPAEAAPASVLPAVGGQPGLQCPATPRGSSPQCPALRGSEPSMAEVVEAAKRAGCPAFTNSDRPGAPGGERVPERSLMIASYTGRDAGDSTDS